MAIFYGRIVNGSQGKRQHASRMGRVDDPVVPKAGARVKRVPLMFILLCYCGTEDLLILCRPGLPNFFSPFTLDLSQDLSGGIAPHD